MEPPVSQKPLRFGCPACGIRLVVDQSIAGTEGPCPSCGARIVAPPVEVSKHLVAKDAAPVTMRPRKAPSKAASDGVIPESNVRQSSGPAHQAKPEAVRKGEAHRRAVNPTTVVSQQHQERQNTLVFFKILAAVLVVAAIALGTYYVLKNAA